MSFHRPQLTGVTNMTVMKLTELIHENFRHGK